MNLRRREFITLLGGATAAWPLVARGQEPLMPLVGLLSIASSGADTSSTAGFRQGLREAGFVEGRNVAIEYRWAEGHFDRLSALAADLVSRRAAVIFVNGPPAVRAVMAATTTIPVVFSMGEDPIKEGVVTSINQPGGNVTGFTTFTNQLFSKRIGLLAEMVPTAAVLGLLVNPNNPNADPDAADARGAASALGRQLEVLTARTENDFEAVFAALREGHIGALCVGVDGLFRERREVLFALAARHGVPTMYERREFPVSGGLMSYGIDHVDGWRQAGLYVGRVLKGAKPAELPVVQATKIEFVINLKTAKALGLTVPPSLLATADEVIE
jgi:putative ABC transport system substrate-binding protein